MKSLLCWGVFLLSSIVVLGSDFKAQDLTVGEFFSNPLGRDLSGMSFSWKLPPIRDGIAQSAYQIEVSKDGKAVWDSGLVKSRQSVKVPYDGRAFKSAEKFDWRVRVWDENGKPSAWSDTASFETGLLSNSDWKGGWITTPEPVQDLFSYWEKKEMKRRGVPPVYARKTFSADGKIVSARLYVASRGIFEARINGVKVSDTYWGTGWTNYQKRITSDSFDVTKMLDNGENTLSFIIADGWYAGRIIHRYGNSPKPELLAQLEIIYSDGSRKIVPSDASWKTSFGSYLYSDIYDGEKIDASLEPEGWDKNGFDDSGWKSPQVGNISEIPLITPRRNQPIRVCETLIPISVNEISEGVFILDFGQNMAGVPRLTLKGEKGKTVKIRYAEMLNKDGTLYTENYRSAISTDFYIPASDGTFTYQPTFTFHGYRYVEISGVAEGWKPDTESAVSLALHNDMPITGTFVCSKPKLNILQSNIQWGQRSNYLSVPTDCPQRDERMGWTGDAQIFIPTGAFNMNVNGFFSKWNQDMRDCQKNNGVIGHVIPMDWGDGSPAWADASVICPWEIYLAYGDKKSLSENYDMMKKWLFYQKNTSKNLIRPEVGFGDWLQPSTTHGKNPEHWKGNTPRSLIGTAYFARCADLLSKTAKILRNEKESKEFAALFDEIKAAFIKEFVSPDGTIKGDCQTAYLLPLAFDLLPREIAHKSFDKFLKVLAKTDYYLDTGFVGTPLLNPVLVKFGRMDLAYRIINNEGYPSWIYSINQGATTMWERWNSYSHEKGFGEAKMNSFNHYAYGAIGEWLYRDVAGLWHDENEPGYSNVVFAPKYGGGLTFAGSTYQTPYGCASSFWRIHDGVFNWTAIVPPNSTGTLVFPSDDLAKVKVNGKVPNTNNMRVGSGKYDIQIEI